MRNFALQYPGKFRESAALRTNRACIAVAARDQAARYG